MTKSDAQRFTELTGGCWHEVEPYLNENDTNNYICKKCDLTFYTFYHLGNPNPTYSNPADILNRMKEFCGEEKYRKFIRTKAIGLCQLTDDEWIISIYETYILNPPLLLKKAIEFLEGEK